MIGVQRRSNASNTLQEPSDGQARPGARVRARAVHVAAFMRPFALLGIALLFACAPVSDTARRSQDDSTITDVRLLARAPGSGRVLLTLENLSSGQVGYNLCTSRLERRDGERWTALPSDEVCTMELRTLDPARSVAYEKDLPPGITPGEYRYVTSVESPLGEGQRVIASAPFHVV